MDNQHIDTKEFFLITLRSENGLNTVLSPRMLLGNKLIELILTLLCRKSFTAIPALSGIGLVHFHHLENQRILEQFGLEETLKTV